MPENIIQHEIHDEMQNSYIDYAMSVIVGRALPDVRDGLKPVHRRILYGMRGLGITPDKPYKKSARIVGEVMGKFHPHGDASIYDAMVNLAQPFSTRYPLVDGHGNFGSIDGDPAAAQRYTEARMSPFALQMLRDIEKETVDLIPNFDEEELEPEVLPSRIPNLLVNGSNGIAVGMATSIPPHNLGDTINAVIKVIDNPDIKTKALIRAIKGPDFPTGAHILGTDELEKAYLTGQGKIQVRAVTRMEEAARGRSQIIVTEIPYQVNKAKLLEKMGDLVKDKKIEGIATIRDESSRQGMRVVIEVKREADPHKVLNKLYKLTSLQDTFSMIMLALVDGKPKLLNLKEIIEEYLKHQKEVITRRTEFDLRKAEERAHIVEGLRIAIDNIDEVIKVIRKSHDNAKEKLIKKFKISEIQAQAILDMRLAKLQGLERKKLEEEYKELKRKIKYFKSLLKSKRLLMGVIKEELQEIKRKWADRRRTVITESEEDVPDTHFTSNEEVVISISKNGFIKRLPKGNTAKGKIRHGDYFFDEHECMLSDKLLLFTNLANVYMTDVSSIPETSISSKGTALTKVVALKRGEKVLYGAPYETTKKKFQIICATKHGMVKKVSISEFRMNKRADQICMNLKKNDEIVNILEIKSKDNLCLVTKRGKFIAFSEEDVRSMGKAAQGVTGMTLADNDEIVSAMILQKKGFLITATEQGFLKKTDLKEFKIQSRAGKGMLCYSDKAFSKTGALVGAVIGTNETVAVITEKNGDLNELKLADVQAQGRSTQGNRLSSAESREIDSL